jgi:peptidoglycan hydrolase-like protein with peptidoglycan-binding domain
MKHLLWFSISLLLPLGFAQESKGWTSYVDLIYTDAYSMPLPLLPSCVKEAPDPLTALECFHNLEIIDGEAFADCEADELGECEKRYGYPTPYWPEQLAEIVEDVYAEIYDRYYNNVLKYAAIELGKCGVGFICEPGCAFSAYLRILWHAHGSLNTVYWIETFLASFYYLNSTLWYNLPFPGFGSIVLPVFTKETNLDQYTDYAANINEENPYNKDAETRGFPYTFTSPAFPNLTVPYEQNEVLKGLPGLVGFELLKDELEIATLLENQQFGFSVIFEAYGGTETMLVTPVPCFFAIPIPGIRRAFTDYFTVPEGYPIPHTEETPWVPFAIYESFDLGTALKIAFAIGTQLALDPTPPPVISETPIEEVLVCEPLTLLDLIDVDVLDTKDPTEPELSLGSENLVEALQYLILDKMLPGTTEERASITQLLGRSNVFTDLTVTGILDSDTSAALGSLQGEANLPIGDFDLATLDFLSPVLCEGSEGPAVLALKKALENYGFDLDDTDFFDAATQAAVEEFAKQNGLSDAFVGKDFWNVLFSKQ